MIGRKISHYRIQAELGRGGMGVVYRAHDEVLRRDVALKVLSGEILGHKEQRERILAEARAASALNHPGITTIYEVAEEENQILLVMELAQGKTLRALLADGPLEPRALARLGASVAETLEAAHEKGVMHGDIKPENVIVQANERTKLLDFGIARQLAAETLTLTKSVDRPLRAGDSRIAGTLAYMAPELLRGDATDARADLFSLGVMLYELASGRRPFPGPTVSALMAQILDEPTPPLAGARHIVPAELGRIIRKLLEKKPEERYQTAREVKVDMTSLARDLEIGALLPPAVAGKRALAVLPFKLLTPNAEDDYLSVALADVVINQLSASGELLVRPASTVQRYAKQAVDPLAAARELNVQVVVDGSIQKFGPKLRVHFQAWNAADGASLLSAKHDAEMADLFGLQDKVAESLAQALGVGGKPGSQNSIQPPTHNPMAYQLYLRAAERLTRLDRWDTRTAIEILEEALRQDPRFADAWALLAQARVTMAASFEPGPKWVRRAEDAARRALTIDPANFEAHCAKARVLWSPARNFQHRAAMHSLARALKSAPTNCRALQWRCIILTHVGLHDQAREDGLAALASNPNDAMTLFSIGHAEWNRNQLDAAQDYFARSIALDPSHVWSHLFQQMVPIYQGNLGAAEEKIRLARRKFGDDPMVESAEALLWAVRGEKRKAIEAARKAMHHREILTYSHHAWHTVVAVYAQMGKPALALEILRKVARTGLPDYPLFRDDPFLAPLRREPEFLRQMRALRRVWEKYCEEFGGHCAEQGS